MLLILALHAVLAAVAPSLGRRLGRNVLAACAVAPLATLVWILSTGGDEQHQRYEWVPELGLTVDLRLDAFAALLVFLISGVGLAVFLYAARYFGERPGLGRFAGTLTAFAGAMLGVVLADNLLLVYLFWELTSVTSYLLIGFEDEKGSARASALQAILVTGSGGLAMLAGFVLLGQAAGTFSFSAILADPPTGGTVPAAMALILLGAFTKSAQVPFHAWLPGAMAAPTPVSAYLHSATMVKAGVYLIGRFAPAFAPEIGWWRPVVMGVGIASMLVGGYRALRQDDLKLVLAFGTVSQLGFLIALLGAGVPSLTFAGVSLLLAHGLFKATLFLTVGIVDHQTHTRDLRQLSGVARYLPWTFVAATVATVSMVGLPPLMGFVAKEAAFDAVLEYGSWPAVAGIVAGSVLTFAYGARYLWGAFATKPGVEMAVPAPAGRGLVVPAAVLAAVTLVGSAVPAAVDGVVGDATDALIAGADLHLLLWHGFTTALVLSVVAVGLGLLLFARRESVARWQDRWSFPVSAQRSYERVILVLNQVADRVTGFVQNGSLPVYVGVILLTLLALPGSVLVFRGGLPRDLAFAESPLQVLVGLLVLVAAVATATAQRRFVAVLCLGAVGYGVAVIFVLQGAPDLALTQLLVETIVVVIFMLVLRHLPERFEPVGWRLGSGIRFALAAGTGVFVTLFALVAGSARTAPAVSEAHLDRALSEGGGRNVVNVILTDFRAFDTLGEITVLAIAALGIASLVLARGGREEEENA